MNDNSTLIIKNEIRHEHDNRRLGRCVFGVIAGILIAAGFAFAAQQHFTALEQSIRNVEMQRERERLKREQKRLIFEREMAASPAQLEVRARKIGLQNVSVQQLNRFGENVLESSENTDTNQSRQKSEKTNTAFTKSRNLKAN
jgi:preprotein translocase subunit SecF